MEQHRRPKREWDRRRESPGTVPFGLEAVVIPVSDVDRAKELDTVPGVAAGC